MAILIPCLVQLRAEFDALAPGRSRASDGWIGDAAHAAETSDHNPDETGAVPIHDADKINEVHAIDVDNAGPWPDGVSMETIVQHLLARCRYGEETRLRYVIYNRRIWSASRGWNTERYTGASAHTEHAHFSASYDNNLEATTASWHLEDLVALSADDKTWIEATVSRLVTAAVDKRVGDVVPRVDATGNDIPATDDNPNIVAATALHNLMRDTAKIRTRLEEPPYRPE